MHEKSETDSTSTSSASPKCTYIVESPSCDSHDDKSSMNSARTTPAESPSHSSQMSSESRVSGPYRFSLIGKHQRNVLKRKKVFSVIDEEGEDYGDDDYYYYHDRQVTRQCRFVMFLMGFVMVFTAICLITWGASRPYKFHVQMKVNLKPYLHTNLQHLLGFAKCYYISHFYLFKSLILTIYTHVYICHTSVSYICYTSGGPMNYILGLQMRGSTKF
ncbi:hypothetical protein HanXRQr2_Chr03g0088851 [Helianthus annuus]|uniref:Uncharacterized protein n=1 Tax=Helianthus annuus TaxID=4232 RepID=A0A9K3NTK1_HELAN|nr:hypothetical protein HanXRQr2_Chr03g0088851 [Helianthus annuus]KAJ0606468.1 hypothetical protein HanHA89_Chr03g0085471 [Helianthus annuus]